MAQTHDTLIAAFSEYQQADAVVEKIIEGGFNLKNFSLVGKGYPSRGQLIHFYKAVDRIKFWGKKGAFAGGLAGFLLGQLFLTGMLTLPQPYLIIINLLAWMIIGGLAIGGAMALVAVLFRLRIPKDSLMKHLSDVKADDFLLVAHGTAEEMELAKAIILTTHPVQLHLYHAVKNIKVSSRPYQVNIQDG
ncbi:MAG: hypothetical protein Q7S51_03185 [Gallionellaceae bacterium]|nr:hypothetical protein [Gallionellaceae bacterium]